MFRKQLVILILIWFSLILACFVLFQTFSKGARFAYHQLIDYNDGVKNEQSEDRAKQTRYQVSKQILYKKDAHRLQSRLFSETSDLMFDLQGNGSEFIERLHDLSCTMQERVLEISKNSEGKPFSDPIVEPQLFVRYLKADDALYFYKTGQLEAQEVEIAHYLVPGLLWPISLTPFEPLLQGRAQKLQLSMSKEIHLKAEGFQANLYQWGEEW